MATWSDLNPEQQGIIIQFSNVIRPWCGEIGRLGNHGIVVNDLYNAEASAVLALLDPDAEIPNPTGFVDASPLTKDEMVTLTSYVQGELADYNTELQRQNYTRAAGAQNMIG